MKENIGHHDAEQTRDASRVVGLGGLLGAPCIVEAAKANQYHKKAIEAHKSYLKYVRLTGENLLLVRKRALYGEWGPWLKENCPNISLWTAQGCMRVAENWKELQPNLKENPELSFRAALKAMSELKGSKGKKIVNSDNLFRNKWIQEVFNKAFEEWSEDDVENLDNAVYLAFDQDLEIFIASLIEKLRRNIRRKFKTLTKEDHAKEFEEARERYRLKLRIQKSVLDARQLRHN